MPRHRAVIFLFLCIAAGLGMVISEAASPNPIVTQHGRKSLSEKDVRRVAHQIHDSSSKLLGGTNGKAIAAKITPTWSTAVPPKGLGALAEGKKNLRLQKYAEGAAKCKDCHFDIKPEQKKP